MSSVRFKMMVIVLLLYGWKGRSNIIIAVNIVVVVLATLRMLHVIICDEVMLVNIIVVLLTTLEILHVVI